MAARATGKGGDGENEIEYRRLRQVVVSDQRLAGVLPQFVRTCRSLAEFWPFIQSKFPTYRERTQFLQSQFEPMLQLIERGGSHPTDGRVQQTLSVLDPAHVNEAWEKALIRREQDPEGAITAARTLLETVLKLILEDKQIPIPGDADLPKLYKLAATALQLSPGQHTEQVFKQILGGCSAIIEGLGAVRNRLGDAHGQGSAPVRPAPRHAELAVNLAGTMAQFLVETWRAGGRPPNDGSS